VTRLGTAIGRKPRSDEPGVLMRSAAGGRLGGVWVEGGCWPDFRAGSDSSEAGVAEARCVDGGEARKALITGGLQVRRGDTLGGVEMEIPILRRC